MWFPEMGGGGTGLEVGSSYGLGMGWGVVY